ncbi:circularly permuted type 2 ATP-grasp protein [Pyxidicoccus caerfyrddinensis]|uniref:circularly permuted type 2 ATP-grasp protein n=1 Tax=Pyxidicoccus caerfyrddinensis TaxID=2709663 RepID=UPI0013D9DAEB|nr:circularly permuted type 2 ATP-grasp protein [Pyxidicoccus caerfyrddinensis]
MREAGDTGNPAFQALMSALRQRGGYNLIAEEAAALVPAEVLREDRGQQDAYLEAQGIRQEHKPIPFVGLPYVVTQRAFERMVKQFRQLFGVLERVIDLYLDEPAVREFFRFEPRHERLIRLGASYRPRIQYCRYDFTLGPEGTPRIYELNTHSPAAATYACHFGQMLARSQTLARLRELGLRPLQAPLERPGSFARAMLASAEKSGHLRGGRNVAVLNSRYLTMTTELEHIAEQFRAQGCTAVRGFVEDLRFERGRLYLDEVPVSLVYNKYDDSRGPEAYECAFSRTTAEVQAYLDAYQAQAVLAINSFPSMYLTEQKSTLAFLWSPLLHKYLGREDVALIEEIVPRTRLVRHLDAGALEEVAAHPERYVLKRSLDTRGRSVVIGRSTAPDAWARLVSEARAEPPGDDFVLQDLALAEPNVTRRLEGEVPTQVFTSLACFLFCGEPTGLIVRTSVDETTNVGRRGFMQPPLLIEDPSWTWTPSSSR